MKITNLYNKESNLLKLGLLFVIFGHCSGLENGLARTPPMGWNHWPRFRCNITCNTYPNDCVSEKLLMDMADRMVEDGYLETGYEYIIVDNCWYDTSSDRLQPDPYRFPSGIKAFADYVHNKGLKLGLFYLACICNQGSLNNLKIVADTFADWGVDYIKMQNCNKNYSIIERDYTQFSKYLNDTGRPMVLSCGWPVIYETQGLQPNYNLIAKTCNMWRNSYDIDDYWDSVSKIIKWHSYHQFILFDNHGSGHWKDPDTLIIGNYGLSLEQSRTQMTVWVMLNAPLIMSNDLRKIGPEFRKILLNKEVLALNKDLLGKQGLQLMNVNFIKSLKHKHFEDNTASTWVREVQTNEYEQPFWAIGLINLRLRRPYKFEVGLQEIGLNLRTEYGYKIHNVWDTEQKDYYIPKNGSLSYKVPPTGAALFIAKPLRLKRMSFDIEGSGSLVIHDIQ